MNNLHISLTECRNESRLLKEAGSIISTGIAENVFIAALGADDLEELTLIAPNIELKRFNLITRRLPKCFFVQIFKYLEYVVRVISHCRGKSIGMMNVHALSLLPLGVLLKFVLSAKLVYDAHELETEVNGLSGWRKQFVKFIERSLIRHCDHVFVVGDAIADWYMDEYRIKRPTVVMNTPKYRKSLRTDRLRRELKIPEGKTIFLYQGGLAPSRGVELILETFRLMEGESCVVVFMGYGSLEEMIKDASNVYKNIYLHPAVPPDEVLEYTSSADVGLHLIGNTCLNHNYCMPNKLFEYLMAGLPVMVSNCQEMASFVRRNEVGVVVRDLRSESLVQSIKQFCKMDYGRLSRNTEVIAKEYCWEKQEVNMVEAYRLLFAV